MQHPSRRYGQLKPKSIEGNVFTYHLKQLTARGLIVKSPNGDYSLTPDGKVYVDRLSSSNLLPRIQPKIVTLIACKNNAGQWLVFRRKRQPLLGQVGFIYGKIHQGELVAEAAKRELQEKAGLQADLKHRGDGYISIAEQGALVSQIMFHLFEGTNVQGELQQHGAGDAYWALSVDFTKPEYMAGMPELLRLLARGGERFFVELNFDTDRHAPSLGTSA